MSELDPRYVVESFPFGKDGVTRWGVWRVSGAGARHGAIPVSAGFPKGSVYESKKAAQTALKRWLISKK